jgi:ADP-ribose pyrophosphatase YjhB (NUDIX family)
MIFTEPPADFNPKFQIAFCICQYNDKILFLQRQQGKPQELQWGVPAGKVNPGEMAQEAAKRELYEETGLDFPESQFKFMNQVHDRFSNLDFIVNIFQVIVDEEPSIKLSTKEHIKYSWILPSQFSSVSLMEDVEQIIKTVTIQA